MVDSLQFIFKQLAQQSLYSFQPRSTSKDLLIGYPSKHFPTTFVYSRCVELLINDALISDDAVNISKSNALEPSCTCYLFEGSKTYSQHSFIIRCFESGLKTHLDASAERT
jgi:hypothetical protein